MNGKPLTDKATFNSLFKNPRRNAVRIKTELATLARQVSASVKVRPEDYEDLVQEIFIALVAAAPKVKATGTAWSFLFRCGQWSAWAFAKKRLKTVNVEVTSEMDAHGGIVRTNHQGEEFTVPGRSTATAQPIVRRARGRYRIEAYLERSIKSAQSVLCGLTETDDGFAFASGALMALQRLKSNCQ